MAEPREPALTREDAERLLDGCELHSRLGLRLVEWAYGRVSFDFEPPAFARSRDGPAVHGGAIATALDTAACFAAIAAVGVDCTTIDLRTDFLRPAADAALSVRGTLLRAGRRFAWADATLSTLEGTPLATGRGTFTW